MKIQSERQFLGADVRDPAGRRLGRVIGVDCDPDPYTAAWFLLRLPGWRRELRAVPAKGARLEPAGPLVLAYDKTVVTASPPLPPDGRSTAAVRLELTRYYERHG